jgi:hypothetical protein
MKLFISWSGKRSKLLAEALRGWIPKVINAVEPWLSSDDIAPGRRWSSEIGSQLEKTNFGIICLTRENLNAPWILFEAGALSKFVDQANVVPFLLDNKPSEIQGPLAQFQSLPVNKENVSKLLISMNRAVTLAGERSLSDSDLAESFEVWWPRLETKINEIPKTTTPAQASQRKDRDVLDEILVLVRSLHQEKGSVTSPSDAERILGLLVSPENIRREEFLHYLSSIPEPDRDSILTGLVSYIIKNSLGQDLFHFSTHWPLAGQASLWKRLGKGQKTEPENQEKEKDNNEKDNPPKNRDAKSKS